MELQPTAPPPPGTETPADFPFRVLFADDEEQFRDGLARRLQRAGFACDQAANGPEALRLLGETEYDVLLADIDMPGNQRLELLERIPSAATLPTVLLTGRPAVETAARSVSLRVAAYLVKPPDFGELCRLLTQAATEQRERRFLSESRARLQNWDQEVARLQRILEQPVAEDRAVTMHSYLRLTLRNLVVSLVELEGFLNLHGARAGANEAIERQELVGALRKTVAVLEKTKGQFKSKDLGELRKDLETLLR